MLYSRISLVEWISQICMDLFPYQHGPRNINSCVRLRRDRVAEALHRLLEAEEQAAPTKESETRTMSIFLCANLYALLPAGKWFKLVTVTQKIVWSFEIFEVELVSNVCRALRIAGSSHMWFWWCSQPRGFPVSKEIVMGFWLRKKCFSAIEVGSWFSSLWHRLSRFLVLALCLCLDQQHAQGGSGARKPLASIVEQGLM